MSVLGLIPSTRRHRSSRLLRRAGAAFGALTLGAGVALAGAQPASASVGTTLNVTGFADGTGSCSVAGSSGTCSTLRAAVTYANGNPGSGPFLVTLPAGYYTVSPGDGGGDLPVQAGTNVTIQGGGVASTVVEAGGVLENEIVDVAKGGILSLEDLTLDGGGGMLAVSAGDVLNDGTLTATNTTISGGLDSGEGGGGIYNDGTLTLTSSQVTGNVAEARGTALGGGIYNAPPGTATLDQSSVTGNSAHNGGGGIYNASMLTLTSSVVVGNSAFGSNTEDDGSGAGGGILNAPDATVDLQGSAVVANSGYYQGGGISNLGTVDAEVGPEFASSVVENSSYYEGGGVYNAGTFTSTDSSINQNSATQDGGGGIYNSGSGTANLTGGQVWDNFSGDGQGGAFFNDGALTVSAGATVDGNTSSQNGGALYNDAGTSSFTGVTLQGNQAGGDGGEGGAAYLAGGNLDLDSSTAAGNTADKGGALYVTGTSVVSSVNSTLAMNTVANQGSAVYLNSGSATLSFDTVADNPGPSGDGTVFNEAGSLTMASDIVAYGAQPECTTQAGATSTSKGGNVYSDDTCPTDATTPPDVSSADPELLPLTSVESGQADTMAIGTGAAATSPAVNTTSSPCTDASGTAVTKDEDGRTRPSTVGKEGCDAGAYQLQGAPTPASGTATAALTLSVTGYADGSGTACDIDVSGSTGTCDSLREAVDEANSVAPKTVAIDLGTGEYPLVEALGALEVNNDGGANVTISGAASGLTVVQGGGTLGAELLKIDTPSQVTLESLTLDGGNGDAESGEGGDVYNDGTLDLSHAQVIDGVANNSGGGVYNDTDGSLSLGDSSLVGANFSERGGGIDNLAATSVSNSYVLSNLAEDGDGGGIYNDDTATLSTDQGVISDNMSMDEPGGGIYNTSGGLLGVSNTDIEGNSAIDDGGGVYNASAESGTVGGVSVTGASLSDNTSVIGNHITDDDEGGGLYNSGSASVTNSAIDGNSAFEDGGGVYNSGTTTITGSGLAGNAVYEFGGALENDGGTVVIAGSTVDGNQADFGEGGALYNSGESSLTVTGSDVSDNSAPDGSGGGAYNDGSLMINGSTLSEDSAAGGSGGGAVYNHGSGSLTLENSTLAGDTTAGPVELGSGTALDNEAGATAALSFDTLAGDPGTPVLAAPAVRPALPSAGASTVFDASGTVTLDSDVLAYGNGVQCSDNGGSGTITSAGGNVTSDGSCGLSAGGDHQAVDPTLLPLQSVVGGILTVMPPVGPSSPVVNTTGPSCTDASHGAVTEDEDANPRPTTVNGTLGCEAGAVQLAGGGSPPPSPPPAPAAGPTPPTVTAVSPAFGDPGGGNPVAVTGTGFSTTPGGTTFSFGPNPATGVSCSSATSCTVTAPSGSLGPVDVRATVAGLTSATNPGDVYTYQTSGSGSGPSTVCSNDQDTRFVCQAYLDLQGRAVDPQGVLTWAGGLDSGSLTRPQVVLGIDESIEYRTDVIQDWFRSYLDRSVDSGAVKTFLTLLDQGASEEQVQSMILGSAEYLADSGGTNSGFLAALYQSVLNRPIDPTGSAAWLAALNHLSRQQVALALLDSTEHEGQLVSSWYERFLHRPADPTGLAAWVSAMTSGATDEAVIAGIVGSAEYFSHV